MFKIATAETKSMTYVLNIFTPSCLTFPATFLSCMQKVSHKNVFQMKYSGFYSKVCIKQIIDFKYVSLSSTG